MTKSKSETLPVYTEEKKVWVANPDDVPEEIQKTAPSFAKLNEPK
jgi:hypothetical protein